MSTSRDAVLNQVPLLRRYAFGLTGNKVAGDRLVAEAIEMLVRDRSAVRPDHMAEDCLALMARVRILAPVMPSRELSWLHRRLLELPLAMRQAVLLRSLCGLTLAAAARAMRSCELTVAQLYHDGCILLSASRPSVMIIEDELLIGQQIASIVHGMGLRCVGMARTHDEAVDMAKTVKPDVLLVDYMLRQKQSGVDVVRRIRDHSDPSVIYLTAHPQTVMRERRDDNDLVIAKPFLAGAVIGAMKTKLAQLTA